MKKKPTYEDLESRINDLESKLENNQYKLEMSDCNQEEKVLFQREQEFRTLVENAPDIIYRFDHAFRHTYVNAAVEKATGILKQTFIGKDHRELGMPEDIVVFFQNHIRKVFESGQEIEFSFMFPTPTGEHHYESRYVPEFAKDGTVEHVMGITRDVTERKQAAETLKESETQLKELNATKDKFFSIVAHDLRSPFNSILGFSKLLIENIKDFEVAESEKYLGFINSSTKNTLILLDNLLNWAKSQTGQLSFKPEKIILSEIVLEIIELKKLLAKAKNISLHYSTSDKFEVYADKNMLRVVLRNLISNAIKFTKPEGNINVFAILEQNQVEISISDNGVGMNEATQNKLFKLDTNTSTSGTANEIGSGLGLILCKEFVEKLGGNIWVESEIRKGSTFSFTIPHKSRNPTNDNEKA